MYIAYKQNGKIECVSLSRMSSTRDLISGDLISVIEVDLDSVHPDSFYVSNGELVPLPDKPSSYHQFDYTTKTWVDVRTAETEWPLVRAKRDELLFASDWTQLPDVPLETKESWAAYRQALRDITTQTDPFNIVWPVAPG